MYVARLQDIFNPEKSMAVFQSLVERGRRAAFTEIVTVTPEIAAWLLDRNPSNRPVNKQKVAEIAKDIVSGFWQVNGETIIVSSDGFLNDGQNRLSAVVAADRPIQTAMAFGVSRESRMTVDMGVQRTASNFLAMSDVVNSTTAAAIVLLYKLYIKGVYSNNAIGSNTLTKQEIRATYEANKAEFERATRTARMTSTKPMGPSSVGVAYFVLSRVNPDACETFFDRLADGAGLSRTDPILALRNRLMNSPKRMHSHERLELILRGWNAWREGRDSGIAPRIMGYYPEIHL